MTLRRLLSGKKSEVGDFLRRYVSNVSISSEFENDKEWLRAPENHRFLMNFLNSSMKNPSTANNMNEYIQLKLLGTDSATVPLSATRIISSMLTFPLTTSYCLKLLFPDLKFPSSPVNISVVGARSESSLPPIYWKEFISFISGELKDPTSFSIEFFGPHLMIKDLTTSWTRKFSENGLTLSLTSDILNRCLFHLHPQSNSLLQKSDIFFLFNPGFGSKELASSWRQTLSFLLESRKPIVCTAYSDDDLLKDLGQLQLIGMEEDHQELGNPIEMLISPRANPFANLRKEQRGDEVVITNQYLYCFRLK